jgi:predicted nucleotidyltransferase
VGFVTRHKERDGKLQENLQKLMDVINSDLTNDENVLAVFYGGSIAKGNDDLYSDLDLRVVVKEEVFEEYRINKKDRAKNWGDVLYYEDFPWATHSVAHFRSFVKVDTFYYKPKDLQPSIYLKEEAKIVYDPYGIVKEIYEKSQALDYRLTIEEFEIWRGKFFAHMHEVYRRVMRGEIYYALSSLNMMRWYIASGWDMEKNNLPNEYGVWSKYEGKRAGFEDWQLSLLESWDCDRNPYNIMNVLKLITPEFKRVHKKLCEKLEIEENSEWVNEIIEMVS